MLKLDLELADGWSEVAPRADAPGLLVEEEGRLSQLRGDFSLVREFGAVGPVECPLAYDAKAQTAYRYVSAARLRGADFSQVRGYDLRSGAMRSVLDLPLNHWVLWLLEWLPGSQGGQLLGLLASDESSEEGLVIRHQLFIHQPEAARQRMRPLCRDAYHPLAFSRARKAFLFSGADGIYLVGLKGERLATYCAAEGASGRGGMFDPTGSARVALGGNGLYLWDFDSGVSERLARQGQYPVWAQDGRGIWYSQSSSDLLFYDLERKTTQTVLSVRRTHHTELSFARAARQSPCGRYLAVPLTGKRLKGMTRGTVDASIRERVYTFGHDFCVLDLERREIWRKSGFISNFCWIDRAEVVSV